MTRLPEMESRFPGFEIKIIEGLDAIRSRPWMYLGSTAPSQAATPLVQVAVCALLDRVQSFEGVLLQVILGSDASGTIVLTTPSGTTTKRFGIELPAAEAMMTRVTHRDWAEEPIVDRFCKISLSILTGCSAWCALELRQDGKRWQQRYEKGRVAGPFVDLGPSETSGATLNFQLDPVVLPQIEFDPVDIRQTLSRIEAQFPGLTIEILDRRTGLQE